MSSEDIILDENLDGESAPTDLQDLASVWQRIMNLVIDSATICVTSFFYLGLVIELFDAPENQTSDAENILLLMVFFVPYVYYSLMEFLGGRTIGKYLTRTKVVDSNGLAPKFGVVLLRSLVRLVPFDFVSAFFSSRRMWHDSWTNTFVIKTR